MENKTKLRKDLLTFNQCYDSSHEDKALASRGEFLRKFPRRQLNELSLNDYVVGKNKFSFCNYIEAKTKSWGNIQGSTAYKFGIYYGRTKSDPNKIYRFTKKYGRNKNEAFYNINNAILTLIKDGRRKDFARIDANPLAQMIKAKILCLYFPENYMNICSGDHIELIALESGIK